MTTLSPLEITINAQTVTYLHEEELARLIREKRFPVEYRTHIFNFFTDVPLRIIYRFLHKHNLTENDLQAYYEAHIKEIYPNKELEELFSW